MSTTDIRQLIDALTATLAEAEPPKRRGRPPKASKTAKVTLTKGTAWALLGGKPQFQPKDPTAKASPAQVVSLHFADLLGEAVDAERERSKAKA